MGKNHRGSLFREPVRVEVLVMKFSSRSLTSPLSILRHPVLPTHARQAVRLLTLPVPSSLKYSNIS